MDYEIRIGLSGVIKKDSLRKEKEKKNKFFFFFFFCKKDKVANSKTL
jgi:hypothetical protein